MLDPPALVQVGFNAIKKLRCPMLILTLLALVAIPVAIDLALRGRHQTIELSMARSAATLDKSALM